MQGWVAVSSLTVKVHRTEGATGRGRLGVQEGFFGRPRWDESRVVLPACPPACLPTCPVAYCLDYMPVAGMPEGLLNFAFGVLWMALGGLQKE